MHQSTTMFISLIALSFLCATFGMAQEQQSLNLVIGSERMGGYPCVKYQKKLYMALSDVKALVAGGRGLAFEGGQLRTRSTAASSRSSVLDINPRLASPGSVIATDLVTIDGRQWVALDDLVRATGARLSGPGDGQVTMEIPENCSTCALVVARRR